MSETRGEYRHGNQLAQRGNQNAAKPEAEKLNAMVQVRTTKSHKEQMQAKAAAAGVSLNEWILKTIEKVETMKFYAKAIGHSPDKQEEFNTREEAQEHADFHNKRILAEYASEDDWKNDEHAVEWVVFTQEELDNL